MSNLSRLEQRRDFFLHNSRRDRKADAGRRVGRRIDRGGHVHDLTLGVQQHSTRVAGIDRLVFAVALFTDSAICNGDMPKPEPREIVGVWDELWMGTEKKLGWLGKPLGAAGRLAEQQKDLLAGVDALEQLRGDGVSCVRIDSRFKISANPQAAFLQLSLTGPANGTDLVLILSARAEPTPNAPPESARVIHFDQSHAWVRADAFTYHHYRAGVSPARAEIAFDM